MADKTALSRLLFRLTIAFIVLSGFYLLLGGGWLIASGGSWYYLICGALLLWCGALLWRRRGQALLWYGLLLAGTLIWAVWESGFDFWALAPRCDVLVLLAIWLLLPWVTRELHGAVRGGTEAILAALTLSAGILIYAMLHDPQEIRGRVPEVANRAADAPAAAVPPAEEWPAYGRTQQGTRYSPLRQINDRNVHQLQEAWRYRTGDMKRKSDPGEITSEVTPIKIGRTLYLCTPHQILIALDAVTGKQKWRFDPGLQTTPEFQHVTCRGVSWHASPSASAKPAHCQQRIFLPVNDGRLFALDASDGKRCAQFADNGMLNLQTAMPETRPGAYEPTSPPIITPQVIIIAGAVTDNYSTHEPSGVIRGFDVETGRLRWVFDPGRDDPNHIPVDGEQFVANSPNSWAPAAYDAQRDLVFLPMGVQTPDIWGGNRTPLMERFASGVLALHASTGKLAWFYQTVHHDLWDMDIPAQPTLADIRRPDGQILPAIYIPAKTGNIFVLDRRTGEPIVPAPERPVPQGAAKGDHVAPTQPFSALTYRPAKKLEGADMWGGTLYDQLICRIQFHRLRYEGIFTPPSEQGTLVFPGNLGMFEWGGIAVDSDRQVAIANPMALPFVSRLIPRGPDNPPRPVPEKRGGTGKESGIQPQYGVPYGVTLNPFLSPLGIPCKQPAWGYISAFDLRTHQIVWKKRIGTVRDSTALPLFFKVGMPMLGGPIVTAGNVLFIAATADNYLRAYRVTDGELLWQARLPAGGQATPMTYAVDGKQYVVIAAGGHGSFGTKLGDYIIAYRLPDNDSA